MILIEDYCSFEIAKLLKEKGFDWPCHGSYHIDPKSKIVWTPKPVNDDGHIFMNAPTHQMAMRWLREVHNIHIAIDRGIEHYFVVLTKLKPYQDLTMKNDVFDTYEEAVEAALKYCLTKLI